MWPGSCHDQHIFSSSRLMARFEQGEFGDSLLLGDSGYKNQTFLVTPVTNPRSRAENLYNESLIRSRNVVERQYGVWKARFPILSLGKFCFYCIVFNSSVSIICNFLIKIFLSGMRTSLDKTRAIIVATAVLHNIAIQQNDQLMEDYQPPTENSMDFPVGVGNDSKRQSIINNYFANL